MSFPPSSFGSQVAAIMDVLAKAAVAEITQLLEDGMVVLRLELCRRDREIQELKRSLRAMEAEFREDATTPQNRVSSFPTNGEDIAQQPCTVYLEAKDADPLREPRHETEESRDTGLVVKREPEEELVIQEGANVCFDAGERDNVIWPPPACSTLDKTPVEIQQHIQMFPSHVEQFSAHGNQEGSYESSSTAPEETADDSVRVKVKVPAQPLCVGSSTSESVRNEHFGRVSHPAVSQDQCLQSALPQAGPSAAPSHAQRSTAASEDHTASRNNPRAKRLMNVWRTNQKLFICSVCNRGFLRLSQLEDHESSHQPFKPFRCLECGKSFTQKTRLKTHQSVHTGERPFSCKICGKLFSRQDNCLRHERFHSGLKPYSCGQCGKSFTVLGNLKIHQERHLQGR
ncbi:hypothetical protein Q5P01_022848 [Channa striata]|uniref:C2H2-type domain-containing protein n=1 Tax=Channa striata TaxID=64152 RepID=A0AA88LRQ7_CHASR|nr:hypothetical protein Q5P01_022848 [Channa striata]